MTRPHWLQHSTKSADCLKNVFMGLCYQSKSWVLLYTLFHKVFGCETNKSKWHAQRNDKAHSTSCHAAQSVLHSPFLPKCIKSYPYTGLDRTLGPRRLRPPEFPDNRHKNLARLSALRTYRLYPHEISLLLISVTSWVDPRTIVWPKNCQWKIPMNPPGIEPATFRIATQCRIQFTYFIIY